MKSLKRSFINWLGSPDRVVEALPEKWSDAIEKWSPVLGGEVWVVLVPSTQFWLQKSIQESDYGMLRMQTLVIRSHQKSGWCSGAKEGPEGRNCLGVTVGKTGGDLSIIHLLSTLPGCAGLTWALCVCPFLQEMSTYSLMALRKQHKGATVMLRVKSVLLRRSVDKGQQQEDTRTPELWGAKQSGTEGRGRSGF